MCAHQVFNTTNKNSFINSHVAHIDFAKQLIVENKFKNYKFCNLGTLNVLIKLIDEQRKRTEFRCCAS